VKEPNVNQGHVKLKGRRGGAWPGWLRWWYAQGGPRRDAQIHGLFLSQLAAGNLHPLPTVARIMGVSYSTAWRAVERHVQRLSPDGWPPPVPNGYGLSAEERRNARMRALHQVEGGPFTLAEERYQVPIPDQYDDNGDPAW
jgi:hypothetical protein